MPRLPMNFAAVARRGAREGFAWFLTCVIVVSCVWAFGVPDSCVAQLRLHGFVMTSDSTPVRTAEVRLRLMSDTNTTRITTTDSLGRFSFLVTDANRPASALHSFVLSSGFPNPFSRTTTITYESEICTVMKAEIRNLLGVRIRGLAEGPAAPGRHILTWDGRDDAGTMQPAGMYLAVMHGSASTSFVKLIYAPARESGMAGFPGMGRLAKPATEEMPSVLSGSFDIIDSSTSQPHFYSHYRWERTYSGDTALVFIVDREPDYFIYIGGWTPNHVLTRYDPLRRTIVDTLASFDGEPRLLAMSKKADKIYVSTSYARPDHQYGKIYAVDLATRSSRILSGPKSAYIFPHPNGEIFFVYYRECPPGVAPCNPFVGWIDQEHDSLVVSDSVDIHESTDAIQTLAFHPSLPILYTRRDDGALIAYDFVNKAIVRLYTSGNGGYDPIRLMVSKDGERLFRSYWRTMDLTADSLIGDYFHESENQNLGTFAMNEAGTRIYLTDPWISQTLPIYPTGAVCVYDTRLLTLIDTIMVDHENPTLLVQFSPDEQYLYVTRFWCHLFEYEFATRRRTMTLVPTCIKSFLIHKAR
jgi:hypothetical protein